MNKTVNSSDDLGNIELFDETNDDIKTEIVLFECNDTEAVSYTHLTLPTTPYV